MYLLRQKYIDEGNGEIIKNAYYDRSNRLIVNDITYFQTWSSTNLMFRIHEPHRIRPAKPILNHMSPIPRKSYADTELVNRHQLNAIHKRFVKVTSHEQPLIHKYSTRKTLLGISIGLSIEDRDLTRKAKNILRGVAIGAGIYLSTLGGVNASNNYDKDPVDNKPKTEMTYTNNKDKNNQDGLRDGNTYFTHANDPFLSPYCAPYPGIEPGDFSLNYYGSCDLNGNNERDWGDYVLMQQGSQDDGADPNGNGIKSDSEDLQLLSNYLTDQIPYIPGVDWEVSTSNEKITWLQKCLAIDQTDVYHPGWTCNDYARQLLINFSGIQNIGSLNYTYYDTTMNGRFQNIPMYETATFYSNGSAHRVNFVNVGDSTESFNDAIHLEPQTDEFLEPGDSSLNNFALEQRFNYYARGAPFNDTVHGNYSLIRFDNIEEDPIPTSFPYAVLFQTPINPHPYAELPLNYGSECELETDPDISGWPGNMSEDATAYYSDSTNAMQDTTWRKWWIVGEHPVIDSTLGNQVIYELPDVTAPALDWAPQNPLIVNLGESTSSDVTGIPTFIDNCDGNIPAVQHPDSIYYFGNFLNPQTCDDLKYDIFRPFDATDSSNNVSEEFEHHIKVRDIQPPWWTYPSPSYNLQWTPNWEQDILDNIANDPSIAEDNSPLYSVSWNMIGGPGSSGCSQFEFPITIQWNSQDSCGNIATPYAQYVNVTENISPVITYMPNDTTMNSTQSTNQGNTGGYANGYDNTGENPLQSREDTDNKGTDPSQADFYNYLIWGNQKLTDACGNFADSVQTITVQDTTKPWFTNFTEDIYNNEWGYALNPITPEGVDDNPEAPTTISINSIDTIYGNSDPLSCGYINDAIIKYTYKIQDPSLNFSTKVQNHHMQETEPPQNPQAPGLMNYLFGDQIIPTENPTATDNSGIVNYEWSIGNTNQDPNELVCEHYDYEGEFDWILSDRCNNSVSITSGFNVDKGLTTFYEFFPADITVPEGDTSINITGEPIGKDALNPNLPVNYSYEDELLFQNELQRGWARHFDLEDVCNQFASDSTQYITEDLDVGTPEVTGNRNCSGPAYPNPTTGEIKIPYYGEGNMKFIVFNSTGNKLDEILISNQPTGDYIFKYNFTIFPPGLYLVKFQSVNCCALIKIVKM